MAQAMHMSRHGREACRECDAIPGASWHGRRSPGCRHGAEMLSCGPRGTGEGGGGGGAGAGGGGPPPPQFCGMVSDFLRHDFRFEWEVRDCPHDPQPGSTAREPRVHEFGP
jgi:hypothetical protein